MNRSIDSLTKSVRWKEAANENFGTEKHKNKNKKNYLDGLNSKINIMEEKVNELEDRSIESIHSEHYRRIIRKDLLFLSLEFKEERRKSTMLIKCLKKSDWKLPKVDNRNKSIHLKRVVKPKRVNPKKSMPRHIIIKLMKTKNREKNGKQLEKMDTLLGMGTMIQTVADFSLETRGSRRKWHNIFKLLKIKWNSISSENILQQLRWNKATLRWRMSKRICSQQNCFKRIATGNFFRQKENDCRGKLGASGIKEVQQKLEISGFICNIFIYNKNYRLSFSSWVIWIFCWFKAKIITLSDRVFNVNRCNM